MALHFTPEELTERRTRACDAMAREGLDGLLMFRQFLGREMQGHVAPPRATAISCST